MKGRNAHGKLLGLLARASLLLALPWGLAAAQAPAMSDAEQAAHARHHAARDAIRRTQSDYHIPELRLVRDDGRPVSLLQELDDGRPVYVDFIYTTCTAICPVTSATFAVLQEKLAAAGNAVHLVSISIDPEEDTPRRLAQFRQKYGGGPQWRFYTGTAEASISVQRAFGVYTGDKMGHTPVTFFRAAPGGAWVRLDGFATPDELLAEYRAAPPGR